MHLQGKAASRWPKRGVPARALLPPPPRRLIKAPRQRQGSFPGPSALKGDPGTGELGQGCGGRLGRGRRGAGLSRGCRGCPGKARGTPATCGAGPTSAREPGNSPSGGFGRGTPARGLGGCAARGCSGEGSGFPRGGGEGRAGLLQPRVSTTDSARAAPPARGRGGHRAPAPRSGTGHRVLGTGHPVLAPAPGPAGRGSPSPRGRHHQVPSQSPPSDAGRPTGMAGARVSPVPEGTVASGLWEGRRMASWEGERAQPRSARTVPGAGAETPAPCPGWCTQTLEDRSVGASGRQAAIGKVGIWLRAKG